MAGEDRLDCVQLLAEAERDLAPLACSRIGRRCHLKPPLPIGRRSIVGEPVKMDKWITVKIGGSADNRALGQQLWAADRIELVAENLTGRAARQRVGVAYREIGLVGIKSYHPVHADDRQRDLRMRLAPQAEPGH